MLPAILGGPAIRPAGPPEWPKENAAVSAALQACVRSGDWGRYQGEHCPRLCRRLSEYFAAEQVILCCSGTAAVELALRGLHVGPGDEVVLAGYDFKGNFLDIVTVGATPVLVDIDPRTGQLDPLRAAAAFTDKTRAIIASHLHGGVVDLPTLRPLAAAAGVAIIEDACQMPGAPLHTARAGMQGDVGVISFGGSKLLTAGRGGAVLTNRADVAARIRRYTQRGNDAYPLSELQAAAVVPQLEALDAQREERCGRVVEMLSAMSVCDGLTPLKTANSTVRPDFYKVAFGYDRNAFGGVPRELFARALQAEGIAMYPGFRALHRIHARGRFRQADDLAAATQADSDWLVLHHPVLLDGANAVAEIVQAIDKVRGHAEQLLAAGISLAASSSPWESES